MDIPFDMGDAYYRDLYKTDPVFYRLAKLDPAFASLLKPNGQLDFTDPAAVMQLTKTLLQNDFRLKIELPEDRLCPPVPNRHNYILWLKDLMDTTTYNHQGRKVLGLDIGTGASCIYPLLGCAQRQWYFVGTDVDEKSLFYAKKNVELNDLQNRIQILPRKPDEKLIPLGDADLDFYSMDFVMTNPPFYESEKELLSSAAKKSRPPSSACTGAPVEMVCEGGEVAFVERILTESLILRERIQWYTSMVGKVSSLEVLVDRLREERIDNYAVTEFIQGNKTRRWAVAWSFGPMRPAQRVARGMKALSWKKILPPVVEVDVRTAPTRETGTLSSKIDDTMHSLDLMSWEWDKEKLQGVGRAWENVWGRHYRRRKLRAEHSEAGWSKAGESALGASKDTETCMFGFTIMVCVGLDGTKVWCRWREGRSEPIFQSFCGYLQSHLKNG